ncbi:MAG: hypothetical protein K8S55_01680 [Phycisphaerae bacterium]|nr:hypothetical protein [Phycisphaerae bacterium]
MIPVIISSVLLTMLAILAFYMVARPHIWLRLWSPWQRHTGRRELNTHQKSMLAGVQVRSAMVGLILLAIAVVLPTGIAKKYYDAGPEPESDVIAQQRFADYSLQPLQGGLSLNLEEENLWDDTQQNNIILPFAEYK